MLEDIREIFSDSEETFTVRSEHLAEFLELPSMYRGEPHTFHYWKRYEQGRDQEKPRKVEKEELVRVLQDFENEVEVTVRGRIHETHLLAEIENITGYSYDGLRISTPDEEPLPHPFRRSVKHLNSKSL